MVTYARRWSWGMFAAGLMLTALPTFADDAEGVVRLGQSESTGVVRVSDQTQPTVVRSQSPEYFPNNHCPECQPGGGYVDGGYVDGGYVDGGYVDGGYCPGGAPCGGPCGFRVWSNTPLAQWLATQNMMFRARTGTASANLNRSVAADVQEKHQWFRCKFGYFVPTGCGGAGCPPIGRYRMVYPADPNYFDQRDGQVYAAAGYGGPVSVPLAPVVQHTYNYGWGIPSSRLTPISHAGY